jgi:hypothetical protein
MIWWSTLLPTPFPFPGLTNDLVEYTFANLVSFPWLSGSAFLKLNFVYSQQSGKMPIEIAGLNGTRERCWDLISCNFLYSCAWLEHRRNKTPCKVTVCGTGMHQNPFVSYISSFSLRKLGINFQSIVSQLELPYIHKIKHVSFCLFWFDEQ